MKEFLDHQNQSSINRKSIQPSRYSNTTKLVIGAILAAFAAIFQSAGVFVGFGYVISIFATLPIVLASIVSLRIGVMAYCLTIFLLAVMQPSELLVFPLTTGLLGVCLGIGFNRWKSWIIISLFGGGGLSIGILFLLYVLKFSILGPSVTHIFDINMAFIILFFSVFYSWLWVGLTRRVLKIFIPSNF